MRINLRTRWPLVAGSGAALLIALALTGIQFLRSEYFQAAVHNRLISELEQLTGTRVEVHTYSFDWRSRSATFTGVVIRGTEPANAQPLFRCERLQFRLGIRTLVSRGIAASSMVVDRPQIHIYPLPDGTSNIPGPLATGLKNSLRPGTKLRWRLSHFELNDGDLTLALHRLPLRLSGSDLDLQIDPMSSSTYEAKIAASQLEFAEENRHAAASLDGAVFIGSNYLQIQKLRLKTTNSTADVEGSLHGVANTAVDLKVNGNISATDLSELTQTRLLEAGSLSFDGRVHSTNSLNDLQFQGSASGSSLRCHIQDVILEGANLKSEVVASKQEWKLENLKLQAFGGEFDGKAFWSKDQEILAEGNIRRLPLRAVSKAARLSLSWDAVIEGPVRLRASSLHFDLASADANLAVRSVSGSAPIEGNIRLGYKNPGQVITFGDSVLASVHTSLQFSGSPASRMDLSLTGNDTSELQAALRSLSPVFARVHLPAVLNGGVFDFKGQVLNLSRNPLVKGDLSLSEIRIGNRSVHQVKARGEISERNLVIETLDWRDHTSHIEGNLMAQLDDWALERTSDVEGTFRFSALDLATIAQLDAVRLPKTWSGLVSGTLSFGGTLDQPHGKGRIGIANPRAAGYRFDEIRSDVAIGHRILTFSGGQLQTARDVLNFSGHYRADAASWQTGQLDAQLDSSDLAIETLAGPHFRDLNPQGRIAIKAAIAGKTNSDGLLIQRVDGDITARNLSLRGVRYGQLTATAQTAPGAVNFKLSGNVLEDSVSGSARILLTARNPVHGQLHFSRIQLDWLTSHSSLRLPPSVQGQVGGDMRFAGFLDRPEEITANFQGDKLGIQVQVSENPASKTAADILSFRNSKNFLVDFANGNANLRDLEIVGQDTIMRVEGRLPLREGSGANLTINGTADLRAFEPFVPGVQISGRSQASIVLEGTLQSPSLNGSLRIFDGRMRRAGSPSALESVNGAIAFARQRAILQKLSGRYGGGTVSLEGFVDFDLSGAMIYHLESSTENMRIRYASGVGVTANSVLRLTGTNSSSLLAGTVTVSHAVFNPSADVGNLLAAIGAAQAGSFHQNSLLEDLHLDVHIESTPDLQLNTSLSRDLQASVDLRVRGTAEHPALLGSVSANQGDIKAFGNRYTLNRGQVNFVDPVKINPVLDLDLQTQTRGITVGVSIAGTLGKLNINYRSDPPLQPRDIIALLTLGRTPGTFANLQSPQATNDVNALQSGVNSALGQAITAPSNRLSKLFGITNVRIDPQVQGIINAPQSRLTLEQQVSRNVTITYVTNLSQTSEQIFRLEWALNKQYSIVAIRDDNGEFGIDLQYRKRF